MLYLGLYVLIGIIVSTISLILKFDEKDPSITSIIFGIFWPLVIVATTICLLFYIIPSGLVKLLEVSFEVRKD